MVHDSLRFPALDEIPAPVRLGSPVEQRVYLCNGALVEWNGPSQPVHSPVCVRRGGEIAREYLGSYPMLTRREAEGVLDAARKAYDKGRGHWPTASVTERIRHVEQFVFLMQQQRDSIVRLIMWEIGKSLADSEREFDRTVEYVRRTIDALKDLDRASSRFQVEEGIIGQIRRAPLGIVLCMGPFNYPLNETFTTLIPALIMGNCVVFKPPKFGVLLHMPLLTCFREAFPPGVVGTLYGDGAEVCGPVLESGDLDVLAFIGSSRVANILKKQHPRPNRLRSVLGLDAKNAAIVLADADIKIAVRECLLGSLSFNGQRCTAIKMIFVHESIADRFVRELAEAMGGLKIGMPWEDGVKITPLPEEGKTAYLSELIADAERHGAKVINEKGGEKAETLFRPALLYPVSPKSRVYEEEQFGPVVPVRPFREVQEPIEYVVESSKGQQVSVFGRNPEVVATLVDHLVNQVSRVNLNAQCQRQPDSFPFTGRKDSAEGTLSISDALRVFSIRTLVASRSSADDKALLSSIVRERRSNFLSVDFLF